MAREFATIGIIGLGTMGAGITEVFARNGFSVIGVEVNDEAVARGRQHLEHSTARAVKREKLTEAEAAELLGRITLTTTMKDLHEADFVVEAVVESIEVKKAIFRELEGIVKYQVMRFQLMAPRSAEMTITRPCVPLGAEMMPLPTVSATSVPASAPRKLQTADIASATRGVSARVETEVAIALAASWKPLKTGMPLNRSAGIDAVYPQPGVAGEDDLRLHRGRERTAVFVIPR